MVKFAALQIEFIAMMEVFDMYNGAWIISVFPENDARSQGATWEHDGTDTPPIIFMSDSLYSLYCASEGMVNENLRPGNE